MPAPFKSTVFILLMVVSTAGCLELSPSEDSHVLAKVGNEQLTVETALSTLPESILRVDTLSALRNYRDRWIEEQLMQKEARRLGLESNPEIRHKLERLKSQLILQALKDAILARNQEELEISTEEARNYYQANRDRFILEERYIRFRHMTAQNRSDAENARRSILNGTPWPDVAERYSMAPERQVQESERFFPESMAVSDIPRLQNFLSLIGITEISPVVSHGGAYHFVQLMEEKPAGDNPDLDWLIEQIKQWLYLEKSQRLINTYKRNLYFQADANKDIERTDPGQLLQFIETADVEDATE